MFIDIIKVCIL